MQIKIAMIALIAFRVFSCAAFAVPTLAAEATSSLPQPVERASADDCAIFVEVGKKRMDWGTTTPPDFAFYPELEAERTWKIVRGRNSVLPNP